jgi:competence protein ComEC
VPRAGWLALGALSAALAGGAVAEGEPGLALPALAALVAASVLAVAVLARRGRVRVALFAFGLLTIAGRLLVGGLVADNPPPPGPLPTTPGSWQADVVRLGSTDGGMQRALLLVSPRVPLASDPVNAPASIGPWPVYAWLPRYPVLGGGDRISFDGRLEPLPDGAGFGDALRAQGAVASIRLRSIELVPADQGWLSGIEPIRHAAGDRLFASLPQREAGLASGILVGLRELVDRGVAASFTTSGLSHVVAISGWNIAQVGAVIVSLLRWLPRRSRSILVILAIVLYTLLAGASASVARAAVMGSVALLARESGRRGGAATALGIAIWLLILADPAMASDVGFQLSSAATAGLLAWATPLQERLGRRAWKRVPDWLVETMAVSLAAQAATLPLVLLHFGRLSLVSPLANLMAAPLIAPVMLLSLVALVCGAAMSLGVPAVLLAPGLLPAWLGLAALIAIADLCAALPFASVTLSPPLDQAGAALAATGVLIWGTHTGRALWRDLQNRIRHAPGVPRTPRAGAPVRSPAADGRAANPTALAANPAPSAAHPSGRRWFKVAAALAGTLLLASAAVVAARPDGRLRITALDVGQGDAILIEGDRGARLLIDGGPDPDTLMRRLDDLVPTWDRRIDLVILSHPHEDHAGGLPVLLERYSVGAVAETGMIGNGPAYGALLDELARRGIDTTRLSAGDALRLDGAEAHVLWPRAGEVPLHPANGGSAVNDVSIVLDLRFGERRFLLMGDVEQEIDPELLAEGVGGRGQPPVDLLKVAHHGSRTATTDAFLNAVQPKVAFVSAGLGNPYGHPAPGTIQRIRAAGADVYRTDTDGNLVASSDGTDLRVSVGGAHAPASTTRAASTVTSSAFSCAIARPAVPASGVAQLPPTTGSSRLLAYSGAGPSPQRAPRAPHVHARTRLIAHGPPPVDSRPRPELPCYDRPDDRPIARRGRRAAAGAQAGAAAAPPHDGRGGDRRVPGRAHGRAGPRRGQAARGDRGPPARPGQGASREGSAARARARVRGSEVAYRSRL